MPQLLVVRAHEVPRCVFADPEALALIRGSLTRAIQGRVAPNWAQESGLEETSQIFRTRLSHVGGLYAFGLRQSSQLAEGARNPTHLAMFDSEKGGLLAILFDEFLLPRLSSGLAAAVAIEALGRNLGKRTLACLGGNPYSDWVLRALPLVLPEARVEVYPGPGGDSPSPAIFPGDHVEIKAALPLKGRRLPSLVLLGGRVPLPRHHEELDPGCLVLALPGWHAREAKELDTFLAGFDGFFSDDPEASKKAGLDRLSALRPDVSIQHLGLLTGQRLSPPPASQRLLVDLTDPPYFDTAMGFLAMRKAQKYKLGALVDTELSLPQPS